MLRFAGGLHIVGGRVIVEAELDTQAVAQRIVKDIADLYGHRVQMRVLPAPGNGEGTRCIVRAVAGGDSLARQTGLLDPRVRPVRGLPAQIVSGSVSDAAAAWRGAFLAHGSLTEPGHYTSLEVTCPGPEAALALVGAARRLGIVAKARETRGADRVGIRDSDAITAMMTRLGALSTALVWDERRRRRDIRSVADRPTHFDDANQRRSTRAAAAASARFRRALEILADNIPDHLAEAGNLRIQHSEAALERLSQLTDPPMTKDAIAGRIRRLLTMADKRAHEQGIPGTDSVFTADTVS